MVYPSSCPSPLGFCVYHCLIGNLFKIDNTKVTLATHAIIPAWPDES